MSLCVIFVLRVAYILGGCLDCKSITYVERPSFCISECLATLVFFLSFYFLVALEDVVNTVTQKWCKVQRH